jgi:hypothetical protein
MLFPCFSYVWTEINIDLGQGMMELVAFVSKLFEADIKEFNPNQLIEDKDKYYI